MRASAEVGAFGGLARFVRDVGFPIAVAVFVLWRLDERVGAVVATQQREIDLVERFISRVCVCRVLELPPQGLEDLGDVAPEGRAAPPAPAPQAESGSRFRSLSLRQRVEF